MPVYAVTVLGCDLAPLGCVALDFRMPADDWLEARAKVAYALHLEGVHHGRLIKTPTRDGSPA